MKLSKHLKKIQEKCKKPRYGTYIDDEYYGISNLKDVIELIEIQLKEYIDETDICNIIIKRIDMTDEEYESIPEE